MAEVPVEYKMIKKKVYKAIEKAIGDDLVGILIYGGSASERIFSGISDIDFFIILKKFTELSKPLSEIYTIIGSEFSEFMNNPLFASVLDYDIYLTDQLPNKDGLNGFSAIRAISLRTGELLSGTNPFTDINVKEGDLKNGARKMVQEYIEKLTSYLFMTMDVNMNEEILTAEKEYMAIDAILSSAQAYYIVQNKKYINMPDVTYFAETNPIKGADNELIVTAGLLKQGIETNYSDFYNRAIDFCGYIINII